VPGSLTDNELMLSVKNGDLDKMTLLFKRHHRDLYAFLFHMTHQRGSSEDMLQNVFYRMLKYRHTFTGAGEFKNWMYYLAFNVLKDETKRNKQHIYKNDMADFSERAGPDALADEDIQKKQELSILHSAMENLNQAEKEVIVLSQYQKLKYHEIAKLLNISEGAVKVRVHRAFNQLKSMYFKMASYGK
jgi:RNA polymerase sigma-70 factor (ECF subfamily)